MTILCEECGKEMVIYKSRYKRLKYCSEECRRKAWSKTRTYQTGIEHPGWKGGRYNLHGYWRLARSLLSETEREWFGRKKDILEHRLIMARHLGRALKNFEVVHHLNGNRGDNRIENLQLLISTYHCKARDKIICPKCGFEYSPDTC